MTFDAFRRKDIPERLNHFLNEVVSTRWWVFPDLDGVEECVVQCGVKRYDVGPRSGVPWLCTKNGAAKLRKNEMIFIDVVVATVRCKFTLDARAADLPRDVDGKRGSRRNG